MNLVNSQVKTFRCENDLNSFLQKGTIDQIIAIVPKMSHFVLFYIEKGLEKNKVNVDETQKKITKKG